MGFPPGRRMQCRSARGNKRPFCAMRVRVCFHNQCFDGAASAAVFTRLYRERIRPDAEFDYAGLTHRAGQLFDKNLFNGDENAIVDFKYSTSPQLTWWFDHHQSAFLTPADREHFRKDRSQRKFYDPEFRSCTGLIAHVGRARFGFETGDLEELIHWANIIDGAQYPNARSAVEMQESATQIALVIEGAQGNDVIPQLIRELTHRSLSEVATRPHVTQSYQRLLQKHRKAGEILRKRATLEQGVVFFDLSEDGLESYNKFIPYYLYPESVYSVGISLSPERAKIAVGTNPWNPARKTANLASICERYGGGGHAKVAAISLPPGDREQARRLSREIAAALRQETQ